MKTNTLFLENLLGFGAMERQLFITDDDVRSGRAEVESEDLKVESSIVCSETRSATRHKV